MRQPDLLVIGAGAAGLFAALSAAAQGAEVAVVTKGPLFSSNSYFAQGGIAAALGADDDASLHAADTLAAGRGLCKESAVAVLTAEAPERIADLEALGVVFEPELSREGGHCRRRIVHAGGAETGRVITEKLAERVLLEPSISVSEATGARAARRRGALPRRPDDARRALRAGDADRLRRLRGALGIAPPTPPARSATG